MPVGAALVPGTSVEQTLSLVQDYDNHKNIYAPEVIASKLISHRGDDFQIYLRLLKKKIITGARRYKPEQNSCSFPHLCFASHALRLFTALRRFVAGQACITTSPR